ncbi:MAG: hypothetical protein A2306_09900 [Omnitrophica WOR_2 bacterium RIFOXYB2_FULL_38_16]|nr:MAG: hypothetical protein A2243_04410 [Omnitrophica WOR_2 bacterium RIFOXYA2_FULL_38_17]OGX52716.1 MAG: hypothetical protein A2267_03315 [Omnitrophica WOR_2 bacterium RIFOXYA12_FULL_38_10]OGX59152.1 MAG: hypothetical protein A2447_12455 [Omnitrophica WOR_2 bacterium RIFOXYC2_FULL_38_12]OGX59172.1 MAG: hypothetical protein A2306_09900 [Omnitrophica WOR_2 bacterium RIFOXYB2_FULL_38_16]HBG60656.1 hypothetical protein [Candidatus Omnitrophota bacterium]
MIKEMKMRIESQKLKYWFKNSFYLCFISLLVSMVFGCASTNKTTTTETTVTYPNKGVIYHAGQHTTTTVTTSDDQQNKEIVEKSETTTTTTETKAEHPGVLSSTFHAVGYVISLPFIIIGGLFRIIFGG